MQRKLEDKDWELLLRKIHKGNCTPFLGPETCATVLPAQEMIAREWAKEYGYWRIDCCDLARVAQFVTVDRDPATPKDRLAEQLANTPAPNYNDPDEPHRILADLPLPVYVTTNYDDFMSRALLHRHRDAKTDFCHWNKYVADEPSIFQSQPGLIPTVANPIVYHLHGIASVPASLVLTEDDYLEFLINVTRDDRLPRQIQKAFAGTSLLFVGYRTADWSFRVLFRALVGYLGRTQHTHLCVQLVSKEDGGPGECDEPAKKYLDKYFGDLKIRVYWGTCQDFLSELRRRWESFTLDDQPPIQARAG